MAKRIEEATAGDIVQWGYADEGVLIARGSGVVHVAVETGRSISMEQVAETRITAVLAATEASRETAVEMLMQAAEWAGA